MSDNGYGQAVSMDVLGGSRYYGFIDALSATTRNRFFGYFLAGGLVLGALWLRLLIAPVEAGLAYLTFFPAVTMATLLGGFGPGVFALAISAAVTCYMFFPPYYSFTFAFNATVFNSVFVFAAEEFVVIALVDAVFKMRTSFVSTSKHLAQIEQAQHEIRIAAAAFQAQHGIMITDANAVIVRVNKAFADITGYQPEEVIGQTPKILKSGRHEQSFYAAMWDAILKDGGWQGELWGRRKNGEVYPKWLIITAIKDARGTVTNYVGTEVDISERKAAEDEINFLAFYDPLTGLPNRRLLLDRLRQELAGVARSQKHGALLFIDLDNFKTLNETLGHEKGDLLLQEVSKRLGAAIRQGDTAARLGGDEFVVMLEDLSEKNSDAAAQAESVGTKILTALAQCYILRNHEYHGSASIGVTLFGPDQEAVPELLKQADLAMYQAKAAGRNTLRFFDPEMQVAIKGRAETEKELRKGIGDGQIVSYYQPQVDDQLGVTGAEVLVRWQHPTRGLVFPNDFIPLAEETGLILEIGQAVLDNACAQLVAWAARPETASLTLAVNVSTHQLRQPDFVERVADALRRTGAKPERLKLELTESLLMDSMEDTIAKMTALKDLGIGFALDDFGTGYSSLSYLKRLPLEKLKIDRSFVMDVMTDPNDAAITKTIIALAKSLSLAVIAEGVETDLQRDFLSANGCFAYQGYLYSKPVSLEGFEAFLQRMSAPLP